MSVNAEIVTIGDEILIGQIVDTNSAWIGARFSEEGIQVTRITSIGDRHNEIVSELDNALERASIVIVTGGLGPTKDDITKNALAEVFHCGMRRDAGTYSHVRFLMESRGIDFNESNQSQADVPDAAEIIRNEFGTAPCMLFHRNGHLLFSLPGVPFEMKEIMKSGVIPRIREHFHLQNVIHRTVFTYGIAESTLSEKISSWEENLPAYIRLAYLPGPSGLKLRLSAYNIENRSAVMDEICHRTEELYSIIPENIIGESDDIERDFGLVKAVASELVSRGKALFTAESCTGGSISKALTLESGASEYFLGGVTSYAACIKEGILGISRETVETFSTVSRETAEAMAEGALKISGADYSIATTGNAGPLLDKGTESEVGTVWIAIARKDNNQTFSKCFNFGKLRSITIERATYQSLFMLLNVIRHGNI